eukprot:6173414-Pleurochrysis_carterae.AAC.1
MVLPCTGRIANMSQKNQEKRAVPLGFNSRLGKLSLSCCITTCFVSRSRSEFFSAVVACHRCDSVLLPSADSPATQPSHLLVTEIIDAQAASVLSLIAHQAAFAYTAHGHMRLLATALSKQRESRCPIRPTPSPCPHRFRNLQKMIAAPPNHACRISKPPTTTKSLR